MYLLTGKPLDTYDSQLIKQQRYFCVMKSFHCGYVHLPADNTPFKKNRCPKFHTPFHKNHWLENGNDKRLYRLQWDKNTPGFDDELDSAQIPTSAAFQSHVRQKFGSSDEIRFRDPIVIDNSNIHEYKDSVLYNLIRDNLVLVKEGKPADKFLQQVGDHESPLDHARWKKRNITHLIVIAPPDLNSYQAYLLDEAKECHYEEWMWRVLQSIRGTNVTILYYPAKGISTRCAHGTVINSQSHLSPFTETIDPIEAKAVLHNHQEKSSNNADRSNRHTAHPADFGVTSTYREHCNFFNFRNYRNFFQTLFSPFFIVFSVTFFLTYGYYCLSLFIIYNLSIGDKSTTKLSPQKNKNETERKLIDLLPDSLQSDIKKSGVAIPNLRVGTLVEETVILIMKAISYLGVWMNSNLPRSPYQWLDNVTDDNRLPLNGNQVFDASRFFETIQQNWSSEDRTPLLLFNNICMEAHKLGAHGDSHNCDVRRMLLALKQTDESGGTVGIIGYTRRSVTGSMERMRVLNRIISDMIRHLSDPNHFPKGSHAINQFTHLQLRCEPRFVMLPSICSIKANLNPTVFAQGVIFCVLALMKRFNLTLLELCGVLQAFDYVSDSSCYFIAACVYTLKFVPVADRAVGWNFGFALQKLIYQLYHHQGLVRENRPPQQYHRYVDREADTRNTLEEFTNQAYFRFILGLMSHVNHGKLPDAKKDQKSFYNKVLVLFNKHVKQSGKLIGGNSLVLWTMFGFFPEWFRKSRAALVDKKNPNLQTITTHYQLEEQTTEQIESIFDSMKRGRSDHVRWQLDNTCAEHLFCKFGRVLRAVKEGTHYQDVEFVTYLLRGQLWFDCYDEGTMRNPNTRDTFVIKDAGGKIIHRLSRKCLVNNLTTIQSIRTLAHHTDVRLQLPGKKFSNSEILGFVSRCLSHDSYRKLDKTRRKFENCIPTVDDIPECIVPQQAFLEATEDNFNVLTEYDLDL